jgi:predicted transcriptional regulator YdeE
MLWGFGCDAVDDHQSAVVGRRPMTVVGLEEGTNNGAEANPGAAKIPRVWPHRLEDHLAERLAGTTDPNVTIALYTNYEGSLTWYYSDLVGAGLQVLDARIMAMAAIKSEAADCIAFESRGAMPKAPIGACGTSWADSSDRSTHRQTRVSEFEVQKADTPSAVSILVGAR